MKMKSLFAAIILLLPAVTSVADNNDARIEQLEQRIQALEEARPLRYALLSQVEVMDNLEEKKDIDVDLELAIRDAEREITPRRRELEALEAELRLLAEGSEAYNKKIREYQVKAEQFTQKSRQLTDDIQQQRARRIEALIVKIRAHSAQYARQFGYDLIIEKTALLYGNERDSITTDIIDLMNAEYFEHRYEKEAEAE